MTRIARLQRPLHGWLASRRARRLNPHYSGVLS